MVHINGESDLPRLSKEEKRLLETCDHCGDRFFKLYFHEDTGHDLCEDCKKLYQKWYDEGEQISIKVEASTSGYGQPWYAYDSKIGIDFSCENGEDWKSCGSKIGEGETIQEAIENFLEQTPIGTYFIWN